MPHTCTVCGPPCPDPNTINICVDPCCEKIISSIAMVGYVPESNDLSSTISKRLRNALIWFKEKPIEQKERLDFLSGFAAAFKKQFHSDILVKPGDNGPSLPAHRALLAARSDVFKNMLDSDECKEAPPNDTLTFQEMSHEQLESLLEFLYSGDLPKEKVENHFSSLSRAADKYDIPFLQKFCQNQMLRSLSPSNVLDVLEIADTCSNLTLMADALNFAVKNMKDIVFTDKYKAFALQNPHLALEITRASCTTK